MKWAEDDLKTVISLVKQGKTYDEISSITGRDKNSIRVKMGKVGENYFKHNPQKKKICLQCLNEIQHVGKLFCSTSCSATYNNKLREDTKVNITCETCSVEFKTNKYNSKFCSRKCFNLNRKKLKDAEIESGECQTMDTKRYKKYLYERHGEKCMECGWCAVNEFTNKTPLELHHIDGDSDNNEVSNLQILCPNCHSLTKDWKGAKKNGGRYSKRRVKRREDYKNGKSA